MTFLDWYDSIMHEFGFKAIKAVVIVLIGFLIARIVGLLLRKLLKELELNRLAARTGVKMPLEQAIPSFIEGAGYVITVIYALNSLGITVPAFYIIFLTAAAAAIISLLLGLSNFLPNYMARRKLNLKAGQQVKVKGIKGRIKKISLTATILESQGEIFSIPNRIVARELKR